MEHKFLVVVKGVLRNGLITTKSDLVQLCAVLLKMAIFFLHFVHSNCVITYLALNLAIKLWLFRKETYNILSYTVEPFLADISLLRTFHMVPKIPKFIQSVSVMRTRLKMQTLGYVALVSTVLKKGADKGQIVTEKGELAKAGFV